MKNCEAGCKTFTGGEIKHHPDCVNSPNKQLLHFFLWFRENGELYVNISIEKMIAMYLSGKELSLTS